LEKVRCEQATKFADQAKETIRQRFENSSIQTTTQIAKGAAGIAIVEEAQNWSADLIVVGSHGYGF
jgi:nucleotide-binding universal stress UspA family protein